MLRRLALASSRLQLSELHCTFVARLNTMAADASEAAHKAPLKIDASKLSYKVDTENGKISANLNEEETAFIEFTLDDKNSTMNIARTVTHEKYRGNGIAGRVTKALFDYALGKKYTITSDCWYTPKFMAKAQNDGYKPIWRAKI